MIDLKQLENVKHFNYLDSMERNNARCTREIKSWLALAKAAFNKTKILFTSKSDLHLKQKQANCYIWSIALCGAETWTLRKVAQNTWKVLNCSAGEGWRISVGPIVWEMKYTVKERISPNRIKRRKTNWIGHILRRKSSKTSYWRNDQRRDRSDGNTRKKA